MMADIDKRGLQHQALVSAGPIMTCVPKDAGKCATRVRFDRRRFCAGAARRSSRSAAVRSSCTRPQAPGGRVNRYYDPATGQFLSVDPDVAETGQPYAYTNDDPVNETDPLGLWGWNPISDVTQAAGDVGGAVEHHWRGIAQVAIAATAVTVAVVSVGSLSGVSAVLAGAAIGAVSSGVSYFDLKK